MIINLHSFDSYNLYRHHFGLILSCSLAVMLFHTSKRWLHSITWCVCRQGGEWDLTCLRGLCSAVVMGKILVSPPSRGYFSVLLTKLQTGVVYASAVAPNIKVWEEVAHPWEGEMPAVLGARWLADWGSSHLPLLPGYVWRFLPFEDDGTWKNRN